MQDPPPGPGAVHRPQPPPPARLRPSGCPAYHAPPVRKTPLEPLSQIPSPGSPVSRFLWQSGGLAIGRGAALLALVLIARDLGTERYGEFVVLLALLELATAPWKATVWQGAAARLAAGAGQSGWRTTLALWWLAGTLLLGPVVVWFAGPVAALVFVLTSASTALMAEHIPAHLLAGRQRRIAVATVASQVVRLAAVVVAMVASLLTPTVAIGLIGGAYLVGTALLRAAPTAGDERTGGLFPEVGTEVVIWTEVHGPILVVALLLGLDTAGGFDLLYKLSAAFVELIAGVGLILIPSLVSDEPAPPIVASGIRLPTAGAILIGLAYAVAATPGLSLAIGTDLDFGIAPALLAVTMVLAPWMGVSKATLLTRGGAGWVLPSQLAMAVATLAASTAASLGIGWAAAAVATGHAAGATVRWWGMRRIGALPEMGGLLSPRLLAADITRLPRQIFGRATEGDPPPEVSRASDGA